MKKSVLLCLALIAIYPGLAQNVNIAQHGYLSVYPSNIVSINSKSYYIETSTSGFLVGITNSAQNVFKTQLQGGDGVKLLRTADNKLVALTSRRGSCDFFPGMQGFISKCDTLGVINFTAAVTGQITDITEHPDGSYYLARPFSGNNVGPNILHYSANGGTMVAVPNSFTAINAICALPNGNLLLNGTLNNVLRNVEMSTSGVIINSITTTYQITNFKIAASGLIYGLESGAGSITSYSADLSVVASSTVAIPATTFISDFTLRNDSVFCTGYETTTKKPYYALLGSNLTMLYQTQAFYKNIFPTGISINNLNRVQIVTYGNSTTNTDMRYLGLYQTSRTGSFVSTYDAGVTGYTLLSSTIAGVSSAVPKMIINVFATVQVKNFGNSTINSFYLNYEPSSCFAIYHQKFNVTIPPNSVVTVTPSVFTVLTDWPLTNQAGLNYTATVCLSTSVPNSENDVAADNDSWCQTLTFLDPVGLKETMPADLSAVVYPNPLQNLLNIKSDNLITKIEVTTVAGTLIYSDRPDSPMKQLETTNWAKGIYFLKLETEKGSCVKKVVKE